MCAVLGGAGGTLSVVVCCASCFVHVCRCLQFACCVLPTCVPASLLLLMTAIYGALCLVLHYAAPLDVSKSLTRMAQQHHHEIFPSTLRNALVGSNKPQSSQAIHIGALHIEELCIADKVPPAPTACVGDCVGTFDKCAGKGIGGLKSCCNPDDHCVMKNRFFSACRPRDRPVPDGWAGVVVDCTSTHQ